MPSDDLAAVRDRRVVQAFLWSPRAPTPPPRYLPRALPWMWSLWWRACRRAADFFFERGVETTSQEAFLCHFHPERVWYVPSGWSFLRRTLRPRDVSSSDVFVDFGSGKGRVLCQAARYPFQRVVGVEVSDELNAVARRNVEAQRGKWKCAQVDLVTADAIAFDVPDDMTVAYFYNPFVGETFHRVLDNIVASLDRNPRRVRLIYVMPVMHDAIVETGRFRRVRSVRIVHERALQRIDVYSSVPLREEANPPTSSDGDSLTNALMRRLKHRRRGHSESDQVRSR